MEESIFAKKPKAEKAPKPAKEKTVDSKTFFKNKTFVITFCSVLGGALVLGGGAGFLIGRLTQGNGQSDNRGNVAGLIDDITKNTDKPEQKVEIVPSETAKISYEKFDNGMISMQVPKGWKVETTNDVTTYSVKAYDPKHPSRMVFANLKTQGYQKSDEALAWQKKYYPNYGFAKMPVLNPQTTEQFYKIFPQLHTLTDLSSENAIFPDYSDFKLIQNFGASVFGGDLLRASFVDTSKQKVQGVFTATVRDPGKQMVAQNVMSPLGTQIDVGALIVYDAFFITAPENEMINWEPVLNKSLSTLTYSQSFISAHQKALAAEKQTSNMISNYANKISDGIMDSWNKRQTSYDITSQKRSDATLGYDRIVDTDTGEIYQVTNGAMDHYDGTRYKMAADSDYTKPIAGTINFK